MEIRIESASPDGMRVTYKTFVSTWEELGKLLKYIAEIESKIK